MTTLKTLLNALESTNLKQFLNSETAIPPLCSVILADGSVPNGTLVKVRGMVQDTLDGVMKYKSCGKYDLRYRRGLEEIPDAEGLQFSESYYDVDRYTIVSVPGLHGSDRKSTLDGDDMQIPPQVLAECDELPALVPVSEDFTSPAEAAVSVIPSPIPSQIANPKSQFSLLAHITRDSTEPITEFKLHQVVDIIGLISNAEKLEGDMVTEMPQVNYTMEVLSMSCVKEPEDESVSETDFAENRNAALDALTEIFDGDKLAAEYCLLLLISSRVSSSALPTLGSWCLNLSNSGSLKTEILENLLRKIVKGPVVNIPCSNEILLRHKFYPQRLDTNDFTSPGILQLAAKTVLVLDERLLDEGSVNAFNVLAISKAVRDQELMGMFGEQVVNFPLDIKPIVLTNQGASIFGGINPAQGVNGSTPIVQVPMQRTPDFSKNSSDDSHKFQGIKEYVESCQRLIGKISIPENVIQQFENDWVETRKTESDVPTDDIHIWATMLRSVPASMGASEASLEHWTSIMNLEKERRRRLPNTPPVQDKTERTAFIGA